jgi:H+/Cl- antiporter ClcA
MIHSGAGWALAVSESDTLLKSLGLTTSFRKFHDFHNDGEKRDYVTTGAAAGVAAAFGAPVGGVLFSLEEGASFFSKTLVWRSFFCAMVAVTTLFIIRTVNIHLGQAHANAMFSFGEFFRLNDSVYNFSVWELPLFCLQGIMGGLIGAAFNAMNQRLQQFRMANYINNMKTRWLEVFCISVVMTIVSFGIPTFIPNCTPKPSNMEDWTDQEKDLSSRLVPLYCDPETEYSQTGSLFLTDSDTAIKQLFHFREIGDDAEPTFSSGSLVLFFLPYITLACLNYGAAVPSGLFVPSLLQGKCAVYVVPCCVAPFVLLYYLCISFCSVILIVIFLIIYWI